MSELVGRTLAHYEILEKLGEGGIGRVYRARDLELGREVAIKVLPEELTANPERLTRFEREARAVAALTHPNVVTLYAVEHAGERRLLVMELVRGETLAERIGGGCLALDELFALAVPLAAALGEAHRQGIVHRDVKPGNVMIARDGAVKVLDFGLAKHLLQEEGELEAPTVTGVPTVAGAVLGTAAYMSPEQARGEPIDARSDVFSLGAVLYEMATGRRAFGAGRGSLDTVAAVLHDEPARPRSLAADLPADVEAIILRCLAKEPGRRYASAAAVHDALAESRRRHAPEALPLSALLRRPAVVAPTALLVAALVTGAVWLARREGAGLEARREAVRRVEELLAQERVTEAWATAREALRRHPDDPTFAGLLERTSMSASFATDPPGAEVWIQDYERPDGESFLLGTTPLADVRAPAELLRATVTASGYEEVLLAYLPGGPRADALPLVPRGEGPPGMTRIPAGSYRPPAVVRGDPVAMPAFWIGVHEVTNREWAEFVAAGGYGDSEHWQEPILDGGRELPFAEAIEGFRDATGRPGPAPWRLGRPPEGEGDHPVRGVSWYEAVAYAEWAGAALPTVHHWRRASALVPFADILPASNIEDGEGPAPVGSFQGLALGTFDMAGNVAEWCSSATGDGRRYSLGGAWSDPGYSFWDPLARDPLERAPTVGLRLVRYEQPPDPELTAPVETFSYDFRQVEPATDEVYEVLAGLYRHDGGPLEPELVSVDDGHPDWRKEVVTFDAGWGDERMRVNLYLPRGVEPPYQVVFHMPAGQALSLETSEGLPNRWTDFVPRSGRVLVVPVLWETLERNTGRQPRHQGIRTWADTLLRWGKEVQRSLDYLAGRSDLDGERIAFFGMSLGAEYAPLYLAAEPRFRTAVLLSGCFDQLHMVEEPPEVNPWNFASRVELPVLVVNGRHDFLCPVETAVHPLFDLLAAPADAKRLVLMESGHVPPLDPLIRETLDWLDARMGPVH